MRKTSIAPNVTQKYKLERSTTRITRVLGYIFRLDAFLIFLHRIIQTFTACVFRSSPADVNLAQQMLESIPPQNPKLKNLPFGMMPILEIITLCRRCRHEDKTENWILPTRIPKLYKYSHVSLSVYLRSRRGAERIRQGEGRWNLPPKTALERSDLTEKFC